MPLEHTASGHTWPGLGELTRPSDDAFSPSTFQQSFVTPEFNFNLRMSSNMSNVLEKESIT